MSGAAFNVDDRKNVIKQVHPDLQLASTTVCNPAVQPVANFDWNLCVIRYFFGRGVPQDSEQAVKWYRRAAEQGAAMAQFKLSHMYANGMGVPQDHNQAVKWLRMAAKQDFAAAQVRLAQLYAKGQGTPEDYVKAYAWLNLATAHADCSRTGRESNRIKDALSNQMTAEQLSAAEKLAAGLREGIEASKSR